MIKYAKITNQETKTVDVGIGTNYKFYESIGMEQMDVEQAYNGNWYLAGYAPVKPHNEEIKEQIVSLENQITSRNLRGAILGDEFAINKITQIENEIEALRKQLEGNE